MAAASDNQHSWMEAEVSTAALAGERWNSGVQLCIGTLARTAPRCGASGSPLTKMFSVWTYTDLIPLDRPVGGLRTAQPVDKIGDFCFELLE
jgi:hypothetical protein